MPRDDTGKWFPEGATKVYTGDTDARVWTYENEAGAPYAIGYKGRAKKPSFHYRYRTVEGRADAINRFVEDRKAHAERVAKRRAERKAHRHSLKVGNILYTSWGYDQTNVEFFEVVALKGKTMVGLREVSKLYEPRTCPSSESVSPAPGDYKDDEVIWKRVNTSNACKMSDWGRYAYPWDGTPKHETGWGYGH